MGNDTLDDDIEAIEDAGDTLVLRPNQDNLDHLLRQYTKQAFSGCASKSKAASVKSELQGQG